MKSIKFPAYVPETVRRYFKNQWVIDAMQEGDRECLNRLIMDERMKVVYSLLTSQVQSDSDWEGFIDAAWSARMDFSPYRPARRAKELTQEIADTAKKLAERLRHFDTTGFPAPSAFHSIRELLRQTSWQANDTHMRNRVVGDLELTESRTTTLTLPPKEDEDEPEVRFTATLPPGRVIPDPHSEVNVAWKKAPSLDNLLDTLARVAQTFEPSAPSSMIASAIVSQKKNNKFEYIRAFADLLTNTHQFQINSKMKNIIAKTATVVMDHPGVEVTYEDVNKALILISKRESGRF